MKKLLILLICLCTLLFSGCVIYEHIQSDIDAAGDFAEEFCLALANEDLEIVKQYLSSTSSAPSKEYFEKHLAKTEAYNGIDFSDGITINERSFDTKANINNAYEFDFNLLVGEKNIIMFVTVIKNEYNYEIFSFGVNPSK